MVTNACALRVQERLSSAYPTWTKEQGRELLKSFRGLPDDDYEGAVNCHILDTATGREPPTPSHIRYQLEEYTKSKTRFLQQQAAEKRRLDWAGSLPTQGALAQKYGPLVREAIAEASEVRRRLVADYGLDCRCPVDLAVVMDTLTDAMKEAESRRELSLSVEETLPLAQAHEAKRQTRMEERRQWFTQWRASCGS